MNSCEGCMYCIGTEPAGDLTGRQIVHCASKEKAVKDRMESVYHLRRDGVEKQGYVRVYSLSTCDYCEVDIASDEEEPKLVHNPVNWLEYKEVYDANSSRV